MPRYQNWSISFQRQLTENMAIDIAYVGNHGTRLIDGRSAAGVYDNMNSASVLALGAAALGALFTNGVPDAAVPAGYRTPPYPTFTGTVAQSLRMWPQYRTINWRYLPLGKSHYHALQAAFERRMSRGNWVGIRGTSRAESQRYEQPLHGQLRRRATDFLGGLGLPVTLRQGKAARRQLVGSCG
jgi:hypothetical protein